MKEYKVLPLWRDIEISRYAMLARCNKKTKQNYHKYGGRGITVCESWSNSKIVFYEWMIRKGFKQGLTVDRIDNDGNYTPENCRLITRAQNAKLGNIKNFYAGVDADGGVFLSVGKCEMELAGIDHANVDRGIDRGWKSYGRTWSVYTIDRKILEDYVLEKIDHNDLLDYYESIK